MAQHFRVRTTLIRMVAVAAVPLLLVMMAPPRAQAQLFITSQNTLHLSDSQRGRTKRATIREQNGNYDINLLQEVMKSADLTEVRPGSYLFQDTGLKGVSSYKERYAIIFKRTFTAMNTGSKMVDYGGTKKFSRPPSGTMLKEPSGGAHVWFVDFHAVFGKSVYLRRDEATAMADVYKWFQRRAAGGVKTDRVILGGDWNLPGDDAGFNELSRINPGNMVLTPDVRTSLTRSGEFSQKYDHFVTDGANVNLSACDLTPLPDGRSNGWYRHNVSDHRGIACTAVP